MKNFGGFGKSIPVETCGTENESDIWYRNVARGVAILRGTMGGYTIRPVQNYIYQTEFGQVRLVHKK